MRTGNYNLIQSVAKLEEFAINVNNGIEVDMLRAKNIENAGVKNTLLIKH